MTVSPGATGRRHVGPAARAHDSRPRTTDQGSWRMVGSGDIVNVPLARDINCRIE
jgi:hypothetical protein